MAKLESTKTDTITTISLARFKFLAPDFLLPTFFLTDWFSLAD
jgi:hypothetical protein